MADRGSVPNNTRESKFSQDTIDYDDLPFLIIEEMLPGCRVSPRFVGIDNTPLAKSRILSIKKVHAIQFSERGCYLGRNFGKNPHYSVNKSRFEKEIRARCVQHGVPIKMYPWNKAVTCSDIVIVFNFGLSGGISENTEDIRRMLKRLECSSVHVQDLSKNNISKLDNVLPDRIRGALQKHYGYTSNYSLARLGEQDGGYVCPRLLKADAPSNWRELFGTMTQLGDGMYLHPLAKPLLGNSKSVLFGDSLRTSRFASSIHVQSKLEAITCSTTQYPGTELGIHMDVNNDDTATGVKHNYNYVVCAWHHKKTDKNAVQRCAILGYSRRSVGDFMRRSDACSAFVNNVIKPWIETLPPWRREIQPDSGIFHQDYFSGNAKVDQSGIIVFPPSINKQATYLSAFADAYLRFKGQYETISKAPMTVEKQLECILPIALCNNALPYVRVLQDWIVKPDQMKECIRENITCMFVSYSARCWGSFRQGGHPRHQPTFNADPSLSWIFFALRCLRQIVIKSLKKTSYSYKCIVSDLKQIHRFGDLTAQHIVHTMCLVNLLHPKYGLEATICLGTKTSARLHAKYGINKSSLPCLLEYVAVEMGYTKNLAENVTCKALQTANCRFRDSIMPLQTQVFWVSLHNGEGVLHALTKSQKNCHKADRNRVRRVLYSNKLPFTDVALVSGMSGSATVLPDAVKKWFYDYSERLLNDWGITDVVKRTSLKRGLILRRNLVSRKTRKTSDLRVETITTAPAVDWTKFDEEQLKYYNKEYNEERRRVAFARFGGSDYGSIRCTASSNLRIIHAMGRHRKSGRRLKHRSKDQTMADLNRGTTNLLSLGVGVQCIDLYRIATSCYLDEYRSRNSVNDMNVICKVTTHHETESHGKRRTLHMARASIVALDKVRSVLESTYVSRDNKSQSCRESYCVDEPNFQAIPNFPTDAQTYTTVSSAKEDLLWHLSIRNGNSVRWIPGKCPLPLWRTLTPMNNGSNVTDCSELGSSSYLLLTLQNGPSNCKKGDIFCTMRRDASSHVVACFHNVTKHRRIFNMGEVEFPAASGSSASVIDEFLLDPCVDVGVSLKQSVIQKDLCLQATNHITRLPTLSECRTKEMLPRFTTVSQPLEVDPFGRIDGHCIPLNEYACHISRWSPYWSDVIQIWQCSYVVRTGALGGDKYWHPPGVSLHKRSIRSRKDLFLYLEYCFSSNSSITMEETSDQSSLLSEWLAKKQEKKGKLISKKKSV